MITDECCYEWTHTAPACPSYLDAAFHRSCRRDRALALPAAQAAKLPQQNVGREPGPAH